MKSRDCRKFSRWEETILEKHRTVCEKCKRGVDSAGEWQILPPPFAEFHCAAPRWRELFPYARWRREKRFAIKLHVEASLMGTRDLDRRSVVACAAK